MTERVAHEGSCPSWAGGASWSGGKGEAKGGAAWAKTRIGPAATDSWSTRQHATRGRIALHVALTRRSAHDRVFAWLLASLVRFGLGD